ncbi:hypothetical protein NQ317_018997 [Molorchus minor]|uniref:Carbohydrate kinase PfkB domain-containing protein n=1 Tax=Molorchus minor TaxID=1323400 RepID=A0ABQ9JPK4_9CUCU|nr:hypothetical protein NQ317_018997 [Molorchus minor]
MGKILRTLLDICIAFFEPTDVEISAKPFETPYWKAVKFITPNLNELYHIASFLNIAANEPSRCKIKQAAILARKLANYVENVIVTLGPSGVLIARKGLSNEPFLKVVEDGEINVRHYPGKVVNNLVNVSGAGDCLASGVIAGILSDSTEEKCLSVGFAAAHTSLYSKSAVPVEIFNRNHSSWNISETFQILE